MVDNPDNCIRGDVTFAISDGSDTDMLNCAMPSLSALHQTVRFSLHRQHI